MKIFIGAIELVHDNFPIFLFFCFREKKSTTSLNEPSGGWNKRIIEEDGGWQ